MSEVKTSAGRVQGAERLGCFQFRGIPFAAPPVGRLRWRAPQPYEAWDGVRDCTEFGPICPQITGGMERLGARPGEPLPQSEDCLTLNVFTPELGSANLPVMVWIHGGGFSTGSGRVPWYSGHTFARDGVVCVTINYRVNAFGFLHFEGLEGSGTLGIQDQIAALQWVQENIAAFGGNPSDVTIFGESAGGMSCGTLLGTASAKGLFGKAIPQSGAAHNVHTPEVATKISRKFCEHVGVKPGDTAALEALTVEQLLEGVTAMGAVLASDHKELFGEDFAGTAMVFQPTLDATVPEQPIDAIRDGAASDVGVLVGTCAEEWKLFTVMADDRARGGAVARPLRNLCQQAGRSVDDLVGVYEKHTDGSELDVRNAIETDRIFRVPAIRLAEAQVEHGTTTWMYRFDWRTPAFGGRLGACHALEIPFVFDNLDAPGADVFTGNEGPQPLATAMHDAWVSFAKSGEPGWAPYETTQRPTMVFDESSKVVDDPDGELRALWDGLL